MTKTLRIAPPEAEASSPDALARAERLLDTTVAERYMVEAVISATDTGAVYRAAHVHLRKRVALKVVYAGAPPAEITRLEREAIAGAHVRHPNVAGATDTGVLPDGARYLSIEHIAGASLREVLKLGPLSVERAVRVARQLASALSASHQQGVVHRNVEPRNIVLTGVHGDEARLVDFGRAKIDVSRFGNVSAIGTEEDLTSPTVVLTTSGIIEWSTAYLPPEAVLGSSVLDERADLYSLGVVLFEMLAGRRPFDAGSPVELFAEQRQKRPPTIGERAPGVVVPEELERVLGNLLSVERSERFASAAALAEALEGIKPDDLRAGPRELARSRRPAARATAVSPGARLIRRSKDALADLTYRSRGVLRHPAGWPALAALGACALGLILWLALSKPPRKNAPAPRTDDVEATESPDEAAPSAPPAGSSARMLSSGAALASLSVTEPDAAARRAELSRAVESENWVRAAQTIAALGRSEPSAFRERSVASLVVSTATALETAGGKHADALFKLLESDLGNEGLWLLYGIVRTKGGTRGSARAARVLASPAVTSRAPPGLHIALLLVTTPCAEKRALFSRAVQEGDGRALTALRTLREMDDCPRRRPNPCCFKGDKQLEQAIEQLASRLDNKP